LTLKTGAIPGEGVQPGKADVFMDLFYLALIAGMFCLSWVFVKLLAKI
jgi:hypothetical protein